MIGAWAGMVNRKENRRSRDERETSCEEVSKLSGKCETSDAGSLPRQRGRSNPRRCSRVLAQHPV
jgi:hypothetical protein